MADEGIKSGWDLARRKKKAAPAGPQVDTIEKKPKRLVPISFTDDDRELIDEIVAGPLPFKSVNAFVNQAVKEFLEKVKPMHDRLSKEMAELFPKEIRDLDRK